MWITTLGLLLLTAVYIGMVVALEYKSPVRCLDEPCQSEAVDNTILNWASDFFVGLASFVFALHLSLVSKKEIRRSGILAQVFMAGAFIMAGIGNWLYPNSGIDDHRGMLGYWVVWIVEKLFFATSAVFMAHLALKVSGKTPPESKTSYFAKPEWLMAFLVLFLCSLVGFLTGSIWCSNVPELHVYELLDNDDTDDSDSEQFHVCFPIAKYSNMALNLTYAMLWLPVGCLLQAASRQRPILVMGLPTPLAAMIAIVVQWTVGSFFLVVIFLADFVIIQESNFKAWNTIYGTVLYHWAMVVTLCCLHNVSFGLPLGFENDDDDEGPTPLSWEWWVAMVAGTLPEPKKEDPKDKATDEKSEEYDEESIVSSIGSSSRPRKVVSFNVAEDDEISM